MIVGCPHGGVNSRSFYPFLEPFSCRSRFPASFTALEPSATLAMAAKAKELKAAGKTVYDLSVGEPDFDHPGPHLPGGRRGHAAGPYQVHGCQRHPAN